MSSLLEDLRAGQLVCTYTQAMDLLSVTPPTQGGACATQKASDRERISSFNLTANFAEALELAEFGWSEGADKAVRHKDFANVFTQAETRNVSWDYVDDEGDFTTERLLSGADTFLMRPRFTHRFSSGVRVIVAIGTSSGVHAATMVEQTITIAAGLWRLEVLRVPTELWTVNTLNPSMSGNIRTWHALRIHTSGNTFNLGKITFACGHPDFLRRINFALMERGSVETQKAWGPHYGYPISLNAKTFKTIPFPPWEGDTIIIGNASTNDVKRNTQRILDAYKKAFNRLDNEETIAGGVIEDVIL